MSLLGFCWVKLCRVLWREVFPGYIRVNCIELYNHVSLTGPVPLGCVSESHRAMFICVPLSCVIVSPIELLGWFGLYVWAP